MIPELAPYYDESIPDTYVMAHMLKDNVNHYSADPSRRVKGLLFDRFGNRCLLGRYCDIEGLASRASNASIGASDLIRKYREFVHPRIASLSVSFLSDLVSLHDTDSNWNKSGLTLAGKTQVRQILRSHTGLAAAADRVGFAV